MYVSSEESFRATSFLPLMFQLGCEDSILLGVGFELFIGIMVVSVLLTKMCERRYFYFII